MWVLRVWLVLVALGGCDRLLGLNEVKPVVDAGRAMFVQATGSAAPAPAATVSLVLARPPVAHDLLVVAIATWHNTLMSVTDSAANMYSHTPINPVLSAGHSSLWIVYASDITTASPFAIQIVTTPDSSVPDDTETSATVHEYTDVPAALPFDGVATGMGSSSDTPVVESCAGASPTSDREIEVAAVTHDFTGATSAGADFTLRAVATEDNNCCVTLVTEDNLVTADTSASFTTAVLGGTNLAWACAMVTFRY